VKALRNILSAFSFTCDIDDPAAREEVKRRVQDVFYAPSLETTKDRAAEVLRAFEREYPAAMRSFQEDLDASLVYLRCPLAHHKAIHTTNLLERAFQKSRRRTKVIPHFFKDRACLKLVFSALWQTSQRWRRVTMTELEQQRLDQLRQEPELALHDQ
jgi:transposase-like protein